jgi:hypothetical protein
MADDTNTSELARIRVARMPLSAAELQATHVELGI